MPIKETHTFHVQAVVLRHLEYGEADRILTLFTLEQGKLQAIAKGVRKIHSRKAGHLEPFSQVNLFMAKGRNLAVITQAEAMRTFPGIRADLRLTAYAAYVAELVDRFTYEEGESRQLYNLLVDTLMRLEEGSHPTTVVHYYEVQLLDVLGFRPELTKCAACHKEIQAVDQYFSPKLGGVLCPQCGGRDQAAWHVSMPALKYLRFFQRSPYSKVKDHAIPPAVDVELKLLMEHYLTYLLEHGLKTPKFIQAVS
ncbi:MAG: DNA repair protein RecO [Anaerolineaceae bacterium]|jgi:DNA repair protein RecO (recombination protein O)